MLDGAAAPDVREMFFLHLQAALGLLVIAGAAWAMSENRRAEIVPLALRALVSGTMASGMTGAVIGLLPLG